MSKKWYTADFHLFHNNIINYCDRPFANIWDMHDAIVNGVNVTIEPNDELFILGDVSFYADKVIPILEAMNGQKHFIIGNHDARKMQRWDGWKSVNHYLEIKDRGQLVVLCHYPIESWRRMSYGAIHLHGHRHGNRPEGRENDECPWGFRVDVGVDPWRFRPVNLDILTQKWLAEGKLV